MERNEISRHEVSVYQVLLSAQRWMSNKEIGSHLKLSPRTIRSHTLRFVRMGLVDQMEVFPGHRYRWSEKAEKRNLSYLQRLKQAMEVFKETKEIE